MQSSLKERQVREVKQRESRDQQRLVYDYPQMMVASWIWEFVTPDHRYDDVIGHFRPLQQKSSFLLQALLCPMLGRQTEY